ncbi:MAG: MarR family winged helix-turn-helix transcriptional regulator [Flavobacteriales bacterium]|nr:MarR family winged helix-turn-helix transcriptional regulator [Flavobacteriales bacterium]MCX7767600.1 MarR family winged helix-turn-helix transcriptional regulator [Flavobacteriales bacterium]MDW8410946.1 MarR family winged helix-turn-helix transcriptional regulator [Flavobacteriales bacterium]
MSHNQNSSDISPSLNQKNERGPLAIKIAAALERLSAVVTLLQAEAARRYGLSPLQARCLLLLAQLAPQEGTLTHLAHEFGLSKATLSESLKVLEKKQLISRRPMPNDRRCETLVLSSKGKALVLALQNRLDPLLEVLSKRPHKSSLVVWQELLHLIYTLHRVGIITVIRMCFSCMHYEAKSEGHFCRLMNKPLNAEELQLDCPEHQQIPLSSQNKDTPVS